MVCRSCDGEGFEHGAVQWKMGTVNTKKMWRKRDDQDITAFEYVHAVEIQWVV